MIKGSLVTDDYGNQVISGKAETRVVDDFGDVALLIHHRSVTDDYGTLTSVHHASFPEEC